MESNSKLAHEIPSESQQSSQGVSTSTGTEDAQVDTNNGFSNTEKEVSNVTSSNPKDPASEDQGVKEDHSKDKAEWDEQEDMESGHENGTALDNFKAAVDEIDDNLDEALGQAADSFWNFATSVTGKVTSVVKEGQPGLESLRKNVSSRLAPLDTFGRDLSSQIGALAQTEKPFENLAGSVKSVAASVQKNAQAMEAAILAKANQADGAQGEQDLLSAERDTTGIEISDYSVGVVPVSGGGDPGEDLVDVNKEIAKVGESISNSFVGQTVGGLWSGLWGNIAGAEEETEDTHVDQMPKTRFEKRIYDLQANPDTYCEPAKDLDAFEEWGKSFLLDNHADSCIAILDNHPAIAELYERVVPEVVEEETFWMRYFFAKHTLELEEERRKKLLARAENAVVEEGEDDGWGDDDWDDNMELRRDGTIDTEPSPTDDLPQEEEAGVRPSPDLDSEKSKPSARPSQDSGKASVSNPDTTLKKENKSSLNDSGPTASTAPAVTAEDDWGDDDWE